MTTISGEFGRFDRPRPWILGHRGASHDHLENTLAAFAAAAALGADGVELDARLTADGVVVVHHDATVADARPVASLDRAQLPPFVPTLTAALETCAAHALAVNIEIKVDGHDGDMFADDAREALVESVVELALAGPGPYLVTSFDVACMDAVRSLAPELVTGLLGYVLDVDDFVAGAAAAGHRAINPWAGLVTPELVAAAHAAQLAVHVWTVDDPDHIHALAAYGVDGIITNRPDVARDVVDRG